MNLERLTKLVDGRGGRRREVGVEVARRGEELSGKAAVVAGRLAARVVAEIASDTDGGAIGRLDEVQRLQIGAGDDLFTDVRTRSEHAKGNLYRFTFLGPRQAQREVVVAFATTFDEVVRLKVGTVVLGQVLRVLKVLIAEPFVVDQIVGAEWQSVNLRLAGRVDLPVNRDTEVIVNGIDREATGTGFDVRDFVRDRGSRIVLLAAEPLPVFPDEPVRDEEERFEMQVIHEGHDGRRHTCEGRQFDGVAVAWEDFVDVERDQVARAERRFVGGFDLKARARNVGARDH